MEKCSEKVTKAIQHRLAPELQDAGFGRKALTFRRTRGELVDVVNVQLSQRDLGASGEVVLNLGIYLPRVAQLLGLPVLESPLEFQCTLRHRLGPASAEPDPWWKVSAETACELLGEELAAVYRERGVPWFAARADLKSVDEAAGSPGGIPLDQLASVALSLSLGDRDAAAKRLAGVIERIHQVRARRALPDDPFGSAVLASGRRLANEHGLAWPSA